MINMRVGNMWIFLCLVLCSELKLVMSNNTVTVRYSNRTINLTFESIDDDDDDSLNKISQPPRLVPWYRMTNSFIDGMYSPGRVSLLAFWIGKEFENSNHSIDDGEIFGQVVREGVKRNFMSVRSAVFLIFLIIVIIGLMISGWFICGYRTLGLWGTQPGDPLDSGRSVFVRVVLFLMMLILIIFMIIILCYAISNTIFSAEAFSRAKGANGAIQTSYNQLAYIDSWVANFTEKYAGNEKIKKMGPTREDILKAVTDAYRGYYGYVFEKSGLHLLEYEIKVLSKYTYYTFQSYYQIIENHKAFTETERKINGMKGTFGTNLNQLLRNCKNCEYYKPLANNLVFNSFSLNNTFKDFIVDVSRLATNLLFSTHYKLITKRKHDVLLQIPENKSLYGDTVVFLKNASDSYYAAIFENIQHAIDDFGKLFHRLTKVLSLNTTLPSVRNAHITRHAFTLLFCIVIIIIIIIGLVGLILGCVLPQQPLSDIPQTPINREIAARVLNICAIVAFVTLILLLVFVFGILLVGAPFESEFCQFLTERYRNGLQKLEDDLQHVDNSSSMSGFFTSLLGSCPAGTGTLFDMLHLPLLTDWNSTYAFLKEFGRKTEDIYKVIDYLPDKLPLHHPFFNFCDFYEYALTGEKQTLMEKLSSTTLKLKISKDQIYKSYELPLEMKEITDSATDATMKEKSNVLYKSFVTIVAMDLLADGLKRSYDVAHPWRYLSWHLRNVKDLYYKVRSWLYSPDRINSTRNVFLKFSAAALNRLFKDVLKRDMPCKGIGTALDIYFYNFCYLIVDPWNATWLMFLFMALILMPFLLGLFALILFYRKQNDRRISDIQYLIEKLGKKSEDKIPPPPPTPPPPVPTSPTSERAVSSESDSSVAIVGFNRGCYIFCRACTLCTNFLVYILLCKWMDRKKRARRMNADPKRRRSISELPDQFFPAPVVVPLGCGQELVGRCCCLNFEKRRKSQLEEQDGVKKMKRKKKKRKKKKKEKERPSGEPLIEDDETERTQDTT